MKFNWFRSQLSEPREPFTEEIAEPRVTPRIDPAHVAESKRLWIEQFNQMAYEVTAD